MQNLLAFPPLPVLPPSVSSRVLRHSGLPDNNERLALLGATILPLVVLEHLMQTMPHSTVGELTVQRSRLVEKKTVAKWSVAYGLHLLLESAANASIVQSSEKAQCAVMYAYIGAVKQELGWDAVLDWLVAILKFDDSV